MILSNENGLDISVGIQCYKPGGCEYWGYSTRKLPKPNVFDLYNLSMKKEVALYERGLVDFSSLKDGSSIKNDQQKRQIDLALNNRGNYINKNEIAQYLTLSIGSAHELWCVKRLFLCWGCNSPLNT